MVLFPKVRDENRKYFKPPPHPHLREPGAWCGRRFLLAFWEVLAFGFILQGFFSKSPKISQDVYIIYIYISWKNEGIFEDVHTDLGLLQLLNVMKISIFERGVTFSEAHHVQYLQGVLRN